MATTLAGLAYTLIDEIGTENNSRWINFYERNALKGYTYDEQSWCKWYPFKDGSYLVGLAHFWAVFDHEPKYHECMRLINNEIQRR